VHLDGYDQTDLITGKGPSKRHEVLYFTDRVGKKFSDTIALSLEIGVPIIKNYPVYDFKAQLRLNVTY
jgi:hypothetical protein